MAESIQLNYSEPAQALETKKWFGQKGIMLTRPLDCGQSKQHGCLDWPRRQRASKVFDIKTSCISSSSEETLPWGLFLNILKEALYQGVAEDGFVSSSLVAGGNGCSICLKSQTTIVERKTPTGLYTTGVPARLLSWRQLWKPNYCTSSCNRQWRISTFILVWYIQQE